MAYCSNCGQIIYEGTAFCARCGHEIGNVSSILRTDTILDVSRIPYSIDADGGIVCIDGGLGQTLYVYLDRCVIVTDEDFEACEYLAEQAYSLKRRFDSIQRNTRGLFASPPKDMKKFEIEKGERTIYYTESKGIQAENIGESTIGYIIFYNDYYDEVLFFFDGSYGVIRSEMLKLYNTVLIPAMRIQDQYKEEDDYMAMPIANGFYIAQNGNPVGPLGVDVIQSMIMSGMINADTLFWTEGMTEWKKGGEVDIIKDLL